jgi:glycosyltransferase involved in cell wall biosynthesis
MKKKVDVWYCGSTKAINGVSMTLSIWKSYFILSNKIEFNIYSNDSMILASSRNEETPIRMIFRKIKRYIALVLKKIENGNVFAVYLQILIIPFFHCKNLLDKYQKSDESTILFFQDIYTAYTYLRRYPNTKNPIVFVHHGNGCLLKMIIETYPVIKTNKNILSIIEKMVFHVLKRSTRIVLLGTQSQGVFCLEYPEFADKTQVINIGIPDEKKYITQKDPDSVIRFISTGTVGRRKGHDLLVEAILKLDDSTRNQIRLSIIGLGPLYQDLVLICKNKKLNNIEFLGRVPDVLPLLEESDVFILTSRDEGMPMAVIEAMRTGLALILTDVGCMPDLAKNELNGFLCSPDSNEISNVIKKMVFAREKIKEFKIASRKMYERYFIIHRMIKDYEELFWSL